MNSEHIAQTYGNTVADRLATIGVQAEQRYGAGALFAYPHPVEKQFVTMTLDEAIEICGPAIAAEDETALWARLDKWQATANALRDKYPARLAQSLAKGAQTLQIINGRRAAGGRTQ